MAVIYLKKIFYQHRIKLYCHNFLKQNGSSHVNINCTLYCTCENDVLSCEEYSCSQKATCQNHGQNSSCKCNENYWGNGTTCQNILDCRDIYNSGSTDEGIYSINPPLWPHGPFFVYCKDGWMASIDTQQTPFIYYSYA